MLRIGVSVLAQLPRKNLDSSRRNVMRRLTYFTLPVLLVLLTGCADQATAPDMDVNASFAKGGKKHPKPPPNPSGDPANPVISFLGGSLRNPALQVMDADGGEPDRNI